MSHTDPGLHATTTPPMRTAQPATLLGSVQLATLGEAMMAQRIGLAVVDAALSPVQQRNLERVWDCKVIDRTGLILDIFGERARTCEGALQVELAHLQEHRFDVLYSALGLKYRTDLAIPLGAECDPRGALIVDNHSQISVKGLYAAGDIVRGLDQNVVGMSHAAVAATHIHNRCDLPMEDEPHGAGSGRQD